MRGALFVGVDQPLEITDLTPLDPGPSADGEVIRSVIV